MNKINPYKHNCILDLHGSLLDILMSYGGSNILESKYQNRLCLIFRSGIFVINYTNVQYYSLLIPKFNYR